VAARSAHVLLAEVAPHYSNQAAEAMDGEGCFIKLVKI
jgi:hypothetical protein